MFDSLGALPPALRKAVDDRIGEMAERGAFFNATDAIVKPGPGRRFIRAGESGGRWFVWYEQGGIAYYKAIALFTADAKGALQQTGDYQGFWNSNLCSETDRILDGKHAG